MARDLTRIGERARRLREERFTSIYHYVTDLDHLRACYANLRADSAPGVDGVGKEEYGANLEREAEEPYVGKLLVRFCEGRGGNQVMVLVTPSPKAPRLLTSLERQRRDRLLQLSTYSPTAQGECFQLEDFFPH